MYSKISIVTPNFNGAKYLEETIRSVINQNYPNLEYIVIDGGSTDGSVEIIKKYEKHLAYWVSEPDKGLYHAIQKGFDKSTGEIMGWINSDDILLANSLFTVKNSFDNKDINWLQGLNTVINEDSKIVNLQTPFMTNKVNFMAFEFLSSDKKKLINFGTIQQESTFWRRSLWILAGNSLNLKYKLAADFELWIRFFNFSKLHIIQSGIGAFRKRKDQLSSRLIDEYIDESISIILKEKKLQSFSQKLDLWFYLLLKNHYVKSVNYRISIFLKYFVK